MAGLFITFEGIEGSGKSTQIDLLYKRLVKAGFSVVLTKEPGGTKIGQKIRQLLLDPSYKNMNSRTEILLYTADRAQDVVENIKPALEEGKIVLADRFVDSNIAYQGAGRGLNMDFVRSLNKWVIDSCWPDLTFILDLEVEKGLNRARGISGKQGDRLEQEVVEFHQRVREAYIEMSKEDRYILLDADKKKENLHREIFKIVEGLLYG